MKLTDYPPGSSTHRYRLTPKEIEQRRRQIEIQREKEERHRTKLIEEGKIPPDTKSDEKA